MAIRNRLYPAPGQDQVLMRHCADARYVWNLAVEQQLWWWPGRGTAPGFVDRAGRWHVSFPGGQPPVASAGTGGRIGIDRGVRTALVTSDGQHYRAPRVGNRQAARYLVLQRKLARQRKGSARRRRTGRQMSVLTAQVADRRKDWIEKISTRLVAANDLIILEKLNIEGMVRRPGPKPDPDQPGSFLPNGRRRKSGLNRAILASAWACSDTAPSRRVTRPESRCCS